MPVHLGTSITPSDQALFRDLDYAVMGTAFDVHLLTGTRHGKLLNFSAPSLKSRFINTGYDTVRRKDFIFDDTHWKGGDDHPLKITLVNLLEDWGWGLSRSLYEDALQFLLGDQCQHIPIHLRSENVSLGTMEMAVISDNAMLHTSAIREGFRMYENFLKKRLALTKLKSVF